MFRLLNRLGVRQRIRGIVLIIIGSIVLGGALDVMMLRETLQQEKESTIRQVVESGFSVLAHYQVLEKNGSLSRAAAQASAISVIREMRYNGKEYFWIHDQQVPARIVMHPISPELDGQPLLADKFNCATSLRSSTDGPFVPTNGKTNLLEAFAEVVARSGHGYVTYPWPKVTADGGSTPERFPKLSYVKQFAPWGWIIGSGIYIDDIDAAVQARTTQNLLLLLGASALLLLLAGLIARSITQPLQTTMLAMRDIASGQVGLERRLESEGHSEIAQLAGNFNEMLDQLQARDRALREHQESLEREVSSRTASLREANLQLDAKLVERKRIEKVINESKNRMRALLDATDESVILLAADGEILAINAFAAQRFGKTPQTMFRENFFDYLPAALADTRRAMVRAVADTGETVHFQDQRGGISFDNSLYPVKDDTGVVESVAIYAKDVTEQLRIKLDEELFQQMGTVLMRWGVDSKTIAQIFCDGVLPIFNLGAAWLAVSSGEEKYALLASAGETTGSMFEHLAATPDGAVPCLPLTRVMSSRQRELVRLDDLDCARCLEGRQAMNASEVLLLPLIVHDECWGVLALYGREPGQFSTGLLQQRVVASVNRLVIIVESALRQERLALFDLALAEVASAVMITDAKGKIVWVNRALTQLSGFALADLLGNSPSLFNSGSQDAAFYQSLWQTIGAGQAWCGEVVNRRQDGSLFAVNEMVTPLLDSDGKISHYVAVLEDIGERIRRENELQDNLEHLRTLNEQLENAQNQLLQSEKMASIGQLAAGVAHEINNPIGFVSSNLGTLKIYVDGLMSLVRAYGQADPILAGQPALNAAIEARKQEIDLGFLSEDIQVLLQESREGISRVTRIVQDLKDFSRIDNLDWSEAFLEQGLDSTLNIVWNEIKYKAEVVKEYGGIPPVECLGSQLNQVFMNLLLNAAQAIDNHGTITIRTGATDDSVWVEISDTGRGIPLADQKRIFDPFFTTKPVGQGTGLGLSLAYSIIQKHHGKLEVHSEPGQGSTFRIEIPQRQAGAESHVS